MVSSTSTSGPDAFHHEAFPYPDTEHFVPTAASVVREGLENDDRTLVLASAAKLDELQDALGTDGADVTFVASDRHARNPARVAMILENFRVGADDRHALGINDSPPGRTAAVTLETRLADSLLNVVALRSWAVSLVCLFDTSGLDDDGRHAIRQGHGVVRGSDRNVDFEPELALQLYGGILDPAPFDAARISVSDGGLARARSFVRAEAAAAGLPVDRVDDLVLAVNEIITNSLRYGGGRAGVAVWTADDTAWCEVRDRGHLADPLIGRFAPPASSASGRGVWLANNLCDLVQVRSSSAGTVVRMQVEA